jgi:hypothetical protein
MERESTNLRSSRRAVERAIDLAKSDRKATWKELLEKRKRAERASAVPCRPAKSSR